MLGNAASPAKVHRFGRQLDTHQHLARIHQDSVPCVRRSASPCGTGERYFPARPCDVILRHAAGSTGTPDPPTRRQGRSTGPWGAEHRLRLTQRHQKAIFDSRRCCGESSFHRTTLRSEAGPLGIEIVADACDRVRRKPTGSQVTGGSSSEPHKRPEKTLERAQLEVGMRA